MCTQLDTGVYKDVWRNVISHLNFQNKVQVYCTSRNLNYLVNQYIRQVVFDNRNTVVCSVKLFDNIFTTKLKNESLLLKDTVFRVFSTIFMVQKHLNAFKIENDCLLHALLKNNLNDEIKKIFDLVLDLGINPDLDLLKFQQSPTLLFFALCNQKATCDCPQIIEICRRLIKAGVDPRILDVNSRNVFDARRHLNSLPESKIIIPEEMIQRLEKYAKECMENSGLDKKPIPKLIGDTYESVNPVKREGSERIRRVSHSPSKA